MWDGRTIGWVVSMTSTLCDFNNSAACYDLHSVLAYMGIFQASSNDTLSASLLE